MSDDASDVTKALAAFGAPTLRYHSFSQLQTRPSGPMSPRRPVPGAASPQLFGKAAEPLTEQTEPVAAPESFRGYAEPLSAPVRGEVPPAPLFPPAPMVAPPPRPLAEWAAPVGTAPAPKVAPPMPAPPMPVPPIPAPPSPPVMREVVASDSGTVTPSPHTAVVPERVWAAPMAAPATALPAGPVGVQTGRTLAEVFEFLAA